MIYWAGKSSDDAGVVVEYSPRPTRPAKKYEVVNVPGRNGDLLFEQDAYENYIQTYEVYVRGGRNKLHYSANGVAEWLYAPKGYQRLEDCYDLDHYRLAYYIGTLDIEGVLNTFGRATLEFNCKPQRYLKNGEFALPTITGLSTVHNPTQFTARPIITVYGSGAGALAIGSYTVSFTGLDGFVTLDSETQNAYKNNVNRNLYISTSEFPRLDAGDSEISFSGGITSVSIIPRWWTL